MAPHSSTLAGKSHGWRNLVGYNPWGRKELDTTERLHFHFRLVITFLPRSKHLLISWLQLPSAVILEPPKIVSATISTVSPSICHEVMGSEGRQNENHNHRKLIKLITWTIALSDSMKL